MKQFVNELSERQAVQSHFLVRSKSLQPDKNGKFYMSLVLSDCTGAIDARVWDRAEEFGNFFSIGDVVAIKGVVNLYQNRRQIVVHQLDKMETFDLSQIFPNSQKDPQAMLLELKNLVREHVRHDLIRQLIFEVIEDPEIVPLLLRCPAAKSIHHAYIGGLLDHILSVSGLMLSLHKHYLGQDIKLNLDLLIFGSIFHDIGKIWELQFDDGVSYTDVGRLVGHLSLASELVEKRASRILGFPRDLINILKHIVLSHHGRLEYGSPKRPKFLEAFVVAAIDDLDSKINNIARFITDETEGGARWTRLSQQHERYFFLGIESALKL